MTSIKSFFKDNKLDIFIVLLILYVNTWSLFPILTSYYCGDDLYNFQVIGHIPAFDSSVTNVILNDFRDWIVGQGRFFPFAFYALYVFWIFDNVYLYKIFLFAITLISVGLFARLVYILSEKKNLAYIVLLITPIMFQFKNYHDPFLSFHGLMQIVFIYCLLSLIFLSRYIQTHKNIYLIFSVIFFIFSLLTYEISYTFIVFIFILLFSYRRSDFLFKIKTLSLFVVIEFILLCITIYFKKNASAPVCSYLPNFDLTAIIGTYFNQTISALPLTYVLSNSSINIFGLFRFQDVVFGLILVALITYLTYKKNKLENFYFKNNKVLILLALAIILLPGAPIALSPKYQSEITFGKAYLPVLIEYFGASLLISILIYYARCRLKLLIIICVALISIVLLLNNKSISKLMTGHWEDRKNLLSEILKENKDVVPDGYTICFESEIPLHSKEFLYMYTGHKYNTVKAGKCPSTNSYTLLYKAEGDLVIAKLINNETNATKYTFAKKKNNIWNIEKLNFSFLPFAAVYSGNFDWENNFAWVEKQENIKINMLNTNQNITVSFEATSLDSRQINIFLGENLVKTVDLVPNKMINIDVNVSDSNNEIVIKSDKNPISPNNGDPRLISFGITKISIKDVNK